MEERLHERLVNQEEAVTAISERYAAAAPA